MTKELLIKGITSNIKVDGVEVIKIYGVPMGVGYDMLVFLNNGVYIKMHATGKAWEMPGHLRSNQRVYNDYRGGDKYPERYIERIARYFKEGEGFSNYLRRFKKEQLIKWYEEA